MSDKQSDEKTGSQSGYSIVVPAYNSEQSLPLLVGRLIPIFAALTSPYELIIVNDGSRDHTWKVIDQLSAQHDWICGINLMRNYGQHNALLCGIRQAKYEIIVTMDDDLQNPPEEIAKLSAKLAEGYDVVYGTPEQRQQGLLRNLASEVIYIALHNVMTADVARHVSAFRIFRAHVRNAFVEVRSPYISIDVLLSWGTSRFAYIYVHQAPRQFGRSNYSVRKLISHAFNMFTGFSVWPLQLASILGFSLTAFGFLLLIFIVGRYLVEGSSVSGFPFLASTIAIFSGAQMFMLGIIGEYLARIHFRIMDKPAYVIRETTTH